MQKVWIIWSRLLYFNFKNILDQNFSSFITFQCILHDSWVLFPEFSHSYKLKSRDLISGGTNFAESLNYLVPLLYFNLKSFIDPIFLSVIIFQCILHDSGVLFSEFWNFQILKRRDLISGGKQFCRKSKLLGHPFCILILKLWWTHIFSSFIRLQCILNDSGLLFSEFWIFYKVKRGNLISCGKQFFRKPDLFDCPFSISIIKVLGTEFLRHSLDFNAFWMIQAYFSQSF